MAIDNRRAPAQQSSNPMAILPRQQSPLARTPEAAAMVLERVVTMGDLRYLEPEERVSHYLDTCHSLGLNPRSRPFDWLELDNKVVLYPNKSCADQLRALHHIRIEVSTPEASKDGSMLRCEAKGIMPDGRYDTASKYVPITGYSQQRGGEYRLRGKELANAYMKAETGAKRRVTFSLIGMTNPPQDLDNVQYEVLTVDGRGNIIDNPTPEQKALAENPAMARVIGEPTFERTGDASRAPLAGTPDQRPCPEDLEQPRRPSGPPVTFHCDKGRWSRIWATLPGNVYVNDTDARRGYIGSYTSTWPEAARTDSLSRLLDLVTDVQAERFINDTREHLAELAAAAVADPDGELEGIDGLTNEQADAEAATQRGNDNLPSEDDDLDTRLEAATTKNVGRPRSRTREHSGQDVRSAAQIAGMTPRAPSPAVRTAKSKPILPDEPDWLRSDERKLMLASWGAWATVTRRLDSAHEIPDPQRLSNPRLVTELRGLVGYARQTYDSIYGDHDVTEEVHDDEAPQQPQAEREALDEALADDDDPSEQPEAALAF